MENRYRTKVLWRDTMREPRLMIFDARLIFFLLLLAVHLAIWTLLLLVAAIVVFWLVERAGYRFPSAMRAIRATFAGSERPARYRGHYRQPIDYGFEYRRTALPPASMRKPGRTRLPECAGEPDAATEVAAAERVGLMDA